MHNRNYLFVFGLVLAMLVLGACAPAATPAANTPAPVATTAPANTPAPANPPTTAPAPTTAPTAAATATQAAANTPVAAKTIKVGLVTDTGGVNDKSFNQSAWTGVQKAMKDFGVDAKFIE